ncbi:MAG: hypothetical protein ACI8ZX_002425, partial [Planctomycetota bacterium]
MSFQNIKKALIEISAFFLYFFNYFIPGLDFT